MDHRDHVGLLAPGLSGAPRGAGVRWADVGAGTGAFTLALADLLGPGATIVAVDRDRGALAENARAVAARFPGVVLEPLVAERIATAAGLVDVARIGHVPSRWLGGIYSATARRPLKPAPTGGG
jgi:SAM-dependent methyltransferase